MTERNMLGTVANLPVPLPVQTLEYSAPADDGWRVLTRATVIVAGLFGLTGVVAALGRLLPEVLASRTQNYYLIFTGPLGKVYGVAEIGGQIAACALFVAAVGCLALRPGARLLLIGSAMLLIASFIVTAITSDIFLSITNGMINPFQELSGLAGVVNELIFPMFLIWIMRRSAVRQQFAKVER